MDTCRCSSCLTTRMLRASRSPLCMARLFSSIKVFIRAQMSRGAKVTVSEMHSCKEMPSVSMGAFRFCSSSGYFQKYSVLSEKARGQNFADAMESFKSHLLGRTNAGASRRIR